ncbi:hypothetical protein PDM28_05220 [Stenotrophomonas aracearum]|jgi:hypothetical protein|uniref:Uncharacterized protein n=1 Tax=Stenotrophomonas aracearum TaxID=3003272 RepID=A0ABY9YFY2_9GAMM|nr:hypothetical protein [Stenotrophomonas sp. A5588]WNH49716.1 hypothetical protein PDM28_05220 [Stenotrophomonas sp. A5588]
MLKRTALLIGVLTMVRACVVASVVLAWQGYCFEQRRFVPAQEIERAAIESLLASYPPSVELARQRQPDGNLAVTYGPPSHPMMFAGVDHFLALNPGACQMVPRGWEGHAPSQVSRLLGTETFIVRLRYPVRFYENGRLRAVPDEHFVSVNRCGEVITP